MDEMRLREIAEQAISYLKDNDLLEDFMEDRDIEFDDEEKEYFCCGGNFDMEEYESRPEVNDGWHQQDVIDMYRRER